MKSEGVKSAKLFFEANGAHEANRANKAHRSYRSYRLYFSLFTLSLFTQLVSCEKAEQTYSTHSARFTFSATNLVPQLNTALNNPGQFCTIVAQNNQYVFHSPGIREDYVYERTELDRKSAYVLGLSGLIVGVPILAEQLSAQTSVVCFDLACPNCYEDASITRNLTLLESQRAQCMRCNRLYDLNNQGIIADGAQGKSLYRYRVQYYPSGNTLSVTN